MSLLPKSRTEFQSKTFWEKFFQKRTSSFEWYGEYLDLCHVIHRYLKPQNKALIVGCGNSKLSEELYDVGYTNLYNIDISDTVIKQMVAKNHLKRPDMTFVVMDTTVLTYENDSFDCILDKGTLDAIFTDESSETLLKVRKMFSEVSRVLKVGGRYICISLVQEHILKELLQWFSEGWVIRVHKIDQKQEEKAGIGGHLPVFIFVFTKMVSIPGRPPVKVYEYVNEDSGSSTDSIRCDSINDLMGFVQDCQQYALVRHGLSNINLEEQFQMDLWSTMSSSVPRYTLRVVDQLRKYASNGLFAIFIVPQGRETNWLFSTSDGCKQLAENAGFERLVIVTLHRGHTYNGIDVVKEEVSAKATELRQEGLPKNGKWPVLTLGDSVGTRTVLYEDSSPFSGDFVVEEVEEDDGEWIRRLVFLATPYLAQTEIRMRQGLLSKKVKHKSSKLNNKPRSLSKPTNLEPDHTHLVFELSRSIFAALFLIDQVNWSRPPVAGSCEAAKILTIGLGGGALSMYLQTCLLNLVSQDVVELDPKLLETAIKWFGFVHDQADQPISTNGPGSYLRVHIENGIQFISEVASKGGESYNAVILDVDCKDPSCGLSSPPREFVTPDVLGSIKAVLKPGGIFVTNFCARNKSLESEVLHSVQSVFPTVLVASVPDSVNKILIGLPETRKYIIDCVEWKQVDSAPQPNTSITTPCTASSGNTNVAKFKFSKPLKRKVKEFSSSVISNDDVNKTIFDAFSDCSVHF